MNGVLAAPMTTQLRGRCSGRGDGMGGKGREKGRMRGEPTAVVLVIRREELVVVEAVV